jgi:hypothetical protein
VLRTVQRHGFPPFAVVTEPRAPEARTLFRVRTTYYALRMRSIVKLRSQKVKPLAAGPLAARIRRQAWLGTCPENPHFE